jgi:hypothetical protein
MKNHRFLLGLGLVLLLVGCSTTSVVLAPVGPDPVGIEGVASTGGLQVFSRVTRKYDDKEQGGDGTPGWNQHTDYSIYDLQGKLVKHVGNAPEHYGEAPERVALPAGSYLVKAQAKDYFWVNVPVSIERGRTTEVHLDDNWNPSGDVQKAKLVTVPNGNPVGWRTESTHAVGAN